MADLYIFCKTTPIGSAFKRVTAGNVRSLVQSGHPRSNEAICVSKRPGPNPGYSVSKISATDAMTQSTLAPESLTTLAHFSVSSAMSFPKSAGYIGG